MKNLMEDLDQKLKATENSKPQLRMKYEAILKGDTNKL
jgi:hypothetical protein